MTERVLGPGGGPRRRRLWHVFVVLALTGIGGVLVFAMGASAIGSSTFESADGNTVSNGGKDWESNAPNLSAANDAQTGQNDNSFGQGTAEGDVNVTVVTGSIPNSKADLGRFAAAGETIGTDSYLYLAWARENDSGSVNFDFEINKLAQEDLTVPGPHHLNRSNGDLLIGYSYQGNTLTPDINLRTWSAAGWSDPVNLSTNGCADGSGNASQITENIFNLGSRVRAIGRFGETGINLTCAGVVPAGACDAFSSAYVKSRASQSITSEVKDFIAPVHLSLSNCGAIKVTKTTKVPGKTGPQPQAGVTFTVDGVSQATGDDGTTCFSGIALGSHNVTETVPAGYAADGATTKSVNVTAGTCDSGATAVSFSNSPLTDVTISVDSKVDGGTASTVDCSDNSLDFSTGTNGDGSKTTTPSVAGSKSITCTITIDP